jgi:hypothetical protein
MQCAARFTLEIAALLITAGGLFDLFTPRLPSNLLAFCRDNPQSTKLVRELLRALGGALTAIGLSVFTLVATSSHTIQPHTLVLILLLVLPAECTNAFCMRRVGSPYVFPLAFVLLILVGALLAASKTFS